MEEESEHTEQSQQNTGSKGVNIADLISELDEMDVVGLADLLQHPAHHPAARHGVGVEREVGHGGAPWDHQHALKVAPFRQQSSPLPRAPSTASRSPSPKGEVLTHAQIPQRCPARRRCTWSPARTSHRGGAVRGSGSQGCARRSRRWDGQAKCPIH